MLDTHAAYWLAAERTRLTDLEMAVLNDTGNELAVSAVSIWELRIKWNRFYRSGTRKGPADPTQLLESIHRLGLPVEALSPQHAAAVIKEPIAHSDPFDDLLLTVAQETERRLFTRDGKLRGHPLAFHAD